MLKEKISLSIFAFLGAFLGLLNTALTWRLYGTSVDGDIWMLAIVMIQSFNLLSQLGVEQVAVYSSHAHKLSKQVGLQFDRECITWAMWFGCFFSVVLIIALPLLVELFARGYSADEKGRVSWLCLAFLLQVCWGPAMYVWRQQLLLKGRSQLSVFSNNLYPLIQSFALVLAWISGDSEQLSIAIGIGLVSFIASMLIIFYSHGNQVFLAIPKWSSLLPLIKASFAMRITHSTHNFVIVLIISNILSSGVEGTVSLFQYVKRISDGIASVSVGPHLSIYHAKQNLTWVNSQRKIFNFNIFEYLRSAIPLFIASIFCAIGVFFVLANFYPYYVQNITSIKIFSELFICLLLWQMIISIETIAVGIFVMKNYSKIIFFINIVFILNLLTLVHFINRPYDAISIALACIICQVFSMVVASYWAFKFYKIKFNNG